MARETVNPNCGSLAHYGKPGWRKNANFYTREEDVIIINEVLGRIEKFSLGGNTLWISIGDSGILPDRTWQSVKERYRKIIYPRLREYGISDSDRKILTKGFMKVHLNNRRKKASKLKSGGCSSPSGRYSERLRYTKSGSRKLSSDSSLEIIEDSSDFEEVNQAGVPYNEKPKKRKLYSKESDFIPVSPITVLNRPNNFQVRDCKVRLLKLKNADIKSKCSVSLKSVLPDVGDCFQQVHGAGNACMVSEDLEFTDISCASGNQPVTDVPQDETITDSAKEGGNLECSSMSPKVREHINISNLINENSGTLEHLQVHSHLGLDKNMNTYTFNTLSSQRSVSVEAEEIVDKVNDINVSLKSTACSRKSLSLTVSELVKNLGICYAKKAKQIISSSDENNAARDIVIEKPLKSLDQNLFYTNGSGVNTGCSQLTFPVVYGSFEVLTPGSSYTESEDRRDILQEASENLSCKLISSPAKNSKQTTISTDETGGVLERHSELEDDKCEDQNISGSANARCAKNLLPVVNNLCEKKSSNSSKESETRKDNCLRERKQLVMEDSVYECISCTAENSEQTASIIDEISGTPEVHLEPEGDKYEDQRIGGSANTSCASSRLLPVGFSPNKSDVGKEVGSRETSQLMMANSSYEHISDSEENSEQTTSSIDEAGDTPDIHPEPKSNKCKDQSISSSENAGCEKRLVPVLNNQSEGKLSSFSKKKSEVRKDVGLRDPSQLVTEDPVYKCISVSAENCQNSCNITDHCEISCGDPGLKMLRVLDTSEASEIESQNIIGNSSESSLELDFPLVDRLTSTPCHVHQRSKDGDSSCQYTPKATSLTLEQDFEVFTQIEGSQAQIRSDESRKEDILHSNDIDCIDNDLTETYEEGCCLQ